MCAVRGALHLGAGGVRTGFVFSRVACVPALLFEGSMGLQEGNSVVALFVNMEPNKRKKRRLYRICEG